MGVENGCDLLAPLEGAVLIEKSCKRQIARARHMPPRKAGPRLGSGARIALGRAHIEDLDRGVGKRRLDHGPVGDELGVASCREMARAARHRWPFLCGAVFILPFGEPTIEHRHIIDSHGAERPPHTGRRSGNAVTVIDNNAHAVADPHLAHAGRELDRARQHVRERALAVGNLVDVEKDGARNARLEVFLIGVPPRARQMPRGIDNDDVRGREMGGEPFCGDQPAARVIGHLHLLSSAFVVALIAACSSLIGLIGAACDCLLSRLLFRDICS